MTDNEFHAQEAKNYLGFARDELLQIETTICDKDKAIAKVAEATRAINELLEFAKKHGFQPSVTSADVAESLNKKWGIELSDYAKAVKQKINSLTFVDYVEITETKHVLRLRIIVDAENSTRKAREEQLEKHLGGFLEADKITYGKTNIGFEAVYMAKDIKIPATHTSRIAKS